jgi:uncharacterized protein involved in outer membrane biogenesis
MKDFMASSLSAIQRRLLVIFAALLAFLSVTLLLLILFSESLVRYLVERQGDQMGREITLGSLELKWRWHYSALTASDIRVSNAEGYSDPDFVRIEQLYLTFRPLKLLVGDIEFGEIILTQPHINLERKDYDEANWIFAKDKPQDDPLIEERHDFPVIQTLAVKGGKVRYQDAIKNLAVELGLDWIVGENNDDTRPEQRDGFKISGTGTIQDEAFELEASGASLEALQDSNVDFPLALTLVMGKTTVAVEGNFRDPIRLTGIDAVLTISGDNMADLFYLTSVPLPPTPPYSLSGQLTRSGHVWGYEGFTGNVDGSDLSGDFFYETGNPRPSVRATLTSNLLDSDDLGGFIGLPVAGDNATPEQQKAAAEQAASDDLIPDVPLAVERLRAADLDISLNAKKIVAPALPFKGMDVHFDLQDGLLALTLKNIVLADGSLDGVVSVDARGETPAVSIDLNIRQLQLRQFFEGTRFAETTEGILGGKVSLQGTGASLADLLGVSNGKLTVVMADGTISLLLIEAADLDIGEALPILLGRDQAAQIHCGVFDFVVDEGILTSHIFILDTDDSRVFGDVHINLSDETIGAELSADPKDNSIFSVQTPITISGRLKQPTIGIDAGKAGTRALGAVALGALLTPLAAVIAFTDTGTDKDENCAALIDAAAEGQPGA